MKKKKLLIGSALIVAFILWTIALLFIDRGAIGPDGSVVGFSALNRLIHSLTGVHMGLYVITDWLGLIPIGLIVWFGILGLIQLIKGRSLMRVDRSIIVLGGFYIVVMGIFIFFEAFVINYRPILIDGILEASYPSSTTMLATCVAPTAIMQLRERIKSDLLRGCITAVLTCFTAFMVIGRLISGVHWVTDIIGGLLISSGLVLLYCAMAEE